ncbi:hypothetical protein [Fluoribacter gormanii]|nr:hypothetical protein [Fluoribacter gormanii]
MSDTKNTKKIPLFTIIAMTYSLRKSTRLTHSYAISTSFIKK